MTFRTIVALSALLAFAGCDFQIDLGENVSDLPQLEEPVDNDADINSGNDNGGDNDNDQGDDEGTDDDNSDPTTFLILQENHSGFCQVDGVIEQEHLGFTGLGYANTDNAMGSEIRWSINAQDAGTYLIRVRYANGDDSSRPGHYLVNGTEQVIFEGNSTGDWAQYKLSTEVPVFLNAGLNQVTLKSTSDGGLANIDYLHIAGQNLNPGNCSDDGEDDGGAGDDGGNTGGDNGSGDGDDSGSGNADTPAQVCLDLVQNDDINWRESSLSSDQAIVECLAETLGRPIGFGENTTGGYAADGGSQLVVIRNDASASVAEQLLAAISDPSPNWIVFDKADFADETAIRMHSLYCNDGDVLSALNNATPEQCRNPEQWCEANGVSASSCLNTFYNDKLNDKSLPIRTLLVDSNTTIDGRGTQAFMQFLGFSIGKDSSGQSTHESNNVIITNMEFRGAGHVEDHNLDPDMIRSTGESHNIWIHQNTFDTTGDSAWDIKVGAYDVTLSFNKLINVKRAGLMGSSDSRTINEQITATMHNNLFITEDPYYANKSYDTLRRVPLMRRGQLHAFNNVFYGYRKDILSVRVGGRILFENNIVLNNLDEANDKGDDMPYFLEKLFRDFREGGLEIRNSLVSFSDSNCTMIGQPGDPSASHGSTPEMSIAYLNRSNSQIQNHRFEAGQDLVSYVSATAGKGGETPYLSAMAQEALTVIDAAPETCQATSQVPH
ncbi:CBM35 domain-containing protein [Reinekea blandensis]|nr:CBM35 domain-containing protein [Reinekea blandensis]